MNMPLQLICFGCPHRIRQYNRLIWMKQNFNCQVTKLKAFLCGYRKYDGTGDQERIRLLSCVHMFGVAHQGANRLCCASVANHWFWYMVQHLDNTFSCSCMLHAVNINLIWVGCLLYCIVMIVNKHTRATYECSQGINGINGSRGFVLPGSSLVDGNTDFLVELNIILGH